MENTKTSLAVPFIVLPKKIKKKTISHWEILIDIFLTAILIALPYCSLQKEKRKTSL